MITDVSSRIQQLSASVINKIAAGEVIERPASVVKELLENSVDSLATRIDVEIENGGAELIRIVDNGEGIHPDDLELAVASHATSKIISAEDLFQVRTMGFRGEALASISEVSMFRIRSKQADQPLGREMEVHGGLVKEPQACGCPDGTQIEVRELFFNTPVRRKFLKTQSTEFAHISEQFTRIALANPSLHLTLRHNGKLVHDLPAASDLRERLELFFGSELANNLITVEAEHAGTRIWGFAGHPNQHKGTRKNQYLFLNGRWIQDRSLQHALGEAYRGLVMVGRYPVAFLFLEMDPEQVDVNVHPTKAEVRFQDSQVLYRLLLSSIRNRFLSMDLDSKFSLDKRPDDNLPPQSTRKDSQLLQQELATWAKQQLEQRRSEEIANEQGPGQLPFPVTADPVSSPVHDADEPELLQDNWPPAPASSSSGGPAVSSHLTDIAQTHPASPAAEIRAMQVHDCYLVVETTDGITVIDQHALHERIMYERLRERILAGSVEIQKLLIPITVDLPARETGILLDQTDLLNELGIQIQDFGGNTIALVGYPRMMAKADPQSLLQDVVELLESSGRKVERRDLIDKMLHMMACKAAIKAGQRLSLEEMESLLAQRHLCDDHHHCPHGRPTALKLTRSELDRQFGRLG
ncbi:MAG: DNA mismatch repair endonuclease MutL [Planctomycetaceae bacterium]|nr:DNA mismatch repair endonuclease MutL [Planctomycetaceae bacterium]